MNEELKNKANEVLLQLLNKATEVGEVAMAEIPLVVQELLTYNFVTSLVGFICWLSVAIGSWYGVYRFFKWGLSKNNGGKTNIYIHDMEAMAIFAPFMALMLSPWFLLNTAWLKIWLAPRVYLLEYAASLIK